MPLPFLGPGPGPTIWPGSQLAGTIPALNQGVGGHLIGGFGARRQVATRSFVPASGGFNAGAGPSMSTRVHTTRDAITALQFGFANWYVDSSSGAEKGTGAPITIKASVEYSGVFYPILKNGSTTISIPDGYTLLTDDLAVTIPDNTAFKVHTLFTGGGASGHGVLFTGNASSTFGDRLTFDPTDRTGTGSVPDDVPGFAYGPCFIGAITTKRSAIGFSDSRFYGSGDTADATGDVGIFERGTNPQIGSCNAGIPADRDDWFLAGSARRRELAQGFTDIVIGFGVNGAVAIAQRIINVAAIYNLFPGKTVHGATSSPHTTGAITQANGSDQAVSQDLSSFNTAVKALPSPLASFFDCAKPVSIVATPTKWVIGDVKDDGSGTFIHENATGAKATIPYVDYGCPRPSGNGFTANQSKFIGWSPTRATLTTAFQNGPDGQQTIAKLIEDSSNNTHSVELGASYLLANGTYEYTALVKRLGTGAGHDGQLFFYDSSFANSVFVGFDLSAGAINVAAAVNSGTALSAAYGRIIAVESGYYRICLGFTATGLGAANAHPYLFLQSGGGTFFQGDGVSGLLIGQADIRKVA